MFFKEQTTIGLHVVWDLTHDTVFILFCLLDSIRSEVVTAMCAISLACTAPLWKTGGSSDSNASV